MGETVRKVIIFSSAIIMTILLIFMSMNLFDKTKKINTNIDEKISNTLSQMELENIIKYDNCIINGATALAYIKENYNSVSSIIVTTEKARYDVKEFDKNYIYQQMITYDGIYAIPMDCDFWVTVVYNVNGVVTGIQITYNKE